MAKNPKIDDLDRKILAILMEDARISYTEVAKKLFVSGGTIHVRMRKMEQLGVVKGQTLIVDYDKLGFDIVAFLGIYLDKSSLYDEVSKQLEEIQEIVEANYTTGLYNIYAKIICRDTIHLREVLHDKIQKIAGIQRTETFISLEESVNRPVAVLEQHEQTE